MFLRCPSVAIRYLLSFYLYRRYLIANDGHLRNIAEEEKSIPLTPLTSTEDI
jgi:hypothetical protein